MVAIQYSFLLPLPPPGTTLLQAARVGGVLTNNIVTCHEAFGRRHARPQKKLFSLIGPRAAVFRQFFSGGSSVVALS